MRISELGEFPLIDRFEQIVKLERPDIVVGIGDDVAVLEGRRDDLILATANSQVEDVPFLRERIAPRQLGRRALAVNLSEIAAMGGRLEYALVSLALPREIEAAWFEELYRGMNEEVATSTPVTVVGEIVPAEQGRW